MACFVFFARQFCKVKLQSLYIVYSKCSLMCIVYYAYLTKKVIIYFISSLFTNSTAVVVNKAFVLYRSILEEILVFNFETIVYCMSIPRYGSTRTMLLDLGCMWTRIWAEWLISYLGYPEIMLMLLLAAVRACRNQTLASY